MDLEYQALSYANATEMRESYVERRKRLWGTPKLEAVEVAPPVAPEPPPAPPKQDLAGVVMMLAALAHVSEPHRPVIKFIKAVVARTFRVTVTELDSHLHSPRFVMPRHVTIVLARHFTPLSLPQIGRAIGGRDHTTIMHALRKMQPIYNRLKSELPENASLDQWVAAFKGALVPT